MERTQIEQNLDKSDRKLSENINEGLQAYKIFTFIQLYVLYDLFPKFSKFFDIHKHFLSCTEYFDIVDIVFTFPAFSVYTSLDNTTSSKLFQNHLEILWIGKFRQYLTNDS